MGWEKRGSKLVYYRKVRDAAGRVRSVYCGPGGRGEQAAREDAERRSTRGPVGNATHKKKATAGDRPAVAVADGESPETYSPENSPAAEAVARAGLPDLRHIKKRDDGEADELRGERAGDGAQAPPACSTSDLADLGDIKKEGSPSPMTFFEARDYVRRQTALGGVSYRLAALILYSAGRDVRTTRRRLLEELQPHYGKAW